MTRVSGTFALIAVVAALQVTPPTSWAASAYNRDTHSQSAKKCAERNHASGTLHLADVEFPDTLNPFQSTTSVSPELAQLFIEPLFRYDDHLRPVPVAASEIPTLRNGDLNARTKTVTVRLRHAMHWSDGSEITSADLKFGWQVDANLSTGPACNGACASIKSITTPDRYTAILHLKKIDGAIIPDGMPDPWPHRWSSAAGSWNGNADLAAHILSTDPAFNFFGSDFPTNAAHTKSAACPDASK